MVFADCVVRAGNPGMKAEQFGCLSNSTAIIVKNTFGASEEKGGCKN
jgi:hypothetical protein